MSVLSDTLDAAERELEREPYYSEKSVGGKLWHTITRMAGLIPNTAYSTLLGGLAGAATDTTLAGALEGFKRSATTGGEEGIRYGEYRQMLGQEPVNPWLAGGIDFAATSLVDPLTYLGGIGVAKAGTKLGKVGSLLRKDLLKATPKTEKLPSTLRAGYESAGGGKPPMPSRSPARGITSDFGPQEIPGLIGSPLRQAPLGIAGLLKAGKYTGSELPSSGKILQMDETSRGLFDMPASTLRAAKGEIIPYNVPSVPVGMVYDRAARSAIESSMRPAGLPPIPKALPAGREPLKLGGKLFGETKELTSKPIPMSASSMHPEAKKIFDQIPVPEAPISKVVAQPGRWGKKLWNQPLSEIRLDTLHNAVRGPKGKIVVGKPGSSHSAILPGRSLSQREKALREGYSDPEGSVMFNSVEFEAAGTDAALAYLRAALKAGKKLTDDGYAYVKKHAKVGA